MNKYLKVLLLGSYIWYLGEGLFGPLYAVFAEQVGGDILDLTGAYAVYLIVTGIASITVGRIADNKSYAKYLMLFGYFLNAAGTFAYLLVDSPIDLFAVQATLGIANALATPTWMEMYASHVDKKFMGREWGFSEGGPSIIMGIAIVIGGFIVNEFSFNLLFVVMGCIQVLAFLAQSLILLIGKKEEAVLRI